MRRVLTPAICAAIVLGLWGQIPNQSAPSPGKKAGEGTGSAAPAQTEGAAGSAAAPAVQAPPSSAVPPGAVGKNSTPAPSSQPSSGAQACPEPAGGKPGFFGSIREPSKSAIDGAIITITRKDPPALQIQTNSDSLGCWATPELAASVYNISVEKIGYRRESVTGLTLAATPSRVDITLSPDPCRTTGAKWGGALLLLLFLVTIYAARWHNIAVPGRKRLLARIDDLLARINNCAPPNATTPAAIAAAAALNSRRDELLRIRETLAVFGWDTIKNFLFWSRGEENAAWYAIHYTELEVLDVCPMAPERVTARLATAQAQLAMSDNPVATTMAARIKASMECKDPRTTEAEFRELLHEVQYHVYDLSDTGFADLTSWQNKSIWLTKVGLFLVIVLALAVGNWVLFVAGAAGGFLSRLSQQLKRANVPTDYGASWSTLFLSPVLGALSGWFGVLLIAFASDPQFQLIGGPLKQVQWADPCGPSTLFAAFLLGFSERLFDGIVSKLEDQIQRREDAASKGPEAAAVAPVPRPASPTGTLSAAQGKADTEISVRLSNVDPNSVQRFILLSLDGHENDAKITKREGPNLSFTVPAVTPGLYKVRLYAPDKVDTNMQFTVEG